MFVAVAAGVGYVFVCVCLFWCRAWCSECCSRCCWRLVVASVVVIAAVVNGYVCVLVVMSVSIVAVFGVGSVVAVRCYRCC